MNITITEGSRGSSCIRGSRLNVVATAFSALLALVVFALCGLPFFYDFFKKEFGWLCPVVTFGFVFGVPLPYLVLISRSFERNRGKAMGIAYLGIVAGGAIVRLTANTLEKNMDWHQTLSITGGLSWECLLTSFC